MARKLGGTLGLLIVLLGGCASPGGEDTSRPADAEQIGNLVVSGVPEIPQALTERLRQYQNTRYASVRGWVGDELLIATRFAETAQLHRVAAPLGARSQVTFFKEPVTQAYLPPAVNNLGFVYARDVGGSEFYQLFFYDWADASSTMLTDGKSRYSSVVWDRQGERFAYTTTERNGRSWDIHIQSLDGERVIALETQSGAWGAEDWSPDGSRLLVSRYDSINESYAYQLDLGTGKLQPVLDEALKVSIGSVQYSADGKGVYFTSDLGAEFLRLHYKDLASGDIDVLTGDVPWNVEQFVVSPDGQRLALTINEDGSSRLAVWQLPGRTPLALPELPIGMIGNLAFSGDNTQLAFSLNQPNAPTDVYSIDLAERSLTRWTQSEVGGLDTAGLAVPELISYPTFDQQAGSPRQIPAYVYKPSTAGPHPVVISIHGGPEGQYRPRFSTMFQYMVNELDVAVIAPNVRGSAGYGKSYLQLDNGILREDSVKDIGALLDWVATQPDLDAQRVVVMGGSYGGYMVLAAMVHYSDRLAAGIESVGISNFVTFLTNTQDYRRDLRRAEYGDEREPEMRMVLESISPLNQVEKIQRPLLISQGANDPRVPASESAQIRDALSDAGTPVWYILALDEGHGFRKKVKLYYYTAATMMFLEKFLTDE
jgi:dipeptidyl aminopeptidase/acylaminoacyl peptidase